MLSNSLSFALIYNLIIITRFSIATKIPYPTTFANSTRITIPNASGTAGCPTSCYREVGPLGSVTWTSKFISATITAETLVYVVNKKNNSTRTETITNTEVDLKDYTPLPATKTTRVTLQFGTTSRTEILTFPTVLYSDYPSSYTFCGTLPTTVAGVATCLRYPCGQPPKDFGPFSSDSPVLAYPSHPPIPETVQNISASDLALDPKGSTWEAQWSFDGGYAPLIKPLMPDMGAWGCMDFGAWDAPASALSTALYLTASSTSTEAGEEADATPAAKPNQTKEVPPAVAAKESAEAELQATEASRILANPFGVKKPPAVAETPSHTPSSPIAVAPAVSPDQAESDNKDGSNTPASNQPSEQANSNAGAQSNQAANDNAGSSSVPVANSPGAQAGSGNVASSSNQAANVNQAASPAAAANSPSPQESSSSVSPPADQAANAASPPSSPDENPNSPFLLPIPALTNQASTAVPIATANAVANVVITTTNPQGSIIVTTSQAPGVIITSTNAQGSQLITTLPVISPQSLTNPPTPTPTPIILNGQTLTTNPQSQYILAGQTLSPKTPLTINSNTPVILQPASGTQPPVLIIGTSTTTLPPPPPTPSPTSLPLPLLTLATQTITPNAKNQYLIDNQTLTPGGFIVIGGTTPPSPSLSGETIIGGTTISLAPSATAAVIGTTSTERLSLGGYIVGGLGTGGPNGTGTNGVVPFLGGAAEGCRGFRRYHYLLGVIITMGVLGYY